MTENVEIEKFLRNLFYRKYSFLNSQERPKPDLYYYWFRYDYTKLNILCMDQSRPLFVLFTLQFKRRCCACFSNLGLQGMVGVGRWIHYDLTHCKLAIIGIESQEYRCSTLRCIGLGTVHYLLQQSHF